MSKWGQIPLEVEERARRRAFERYRQDCAGIRVLRRLEREGLAPGTFRHAILTRQLEALPRLFERKRELDRRLRAREISLDQHRRELTLLLREHGLPPATRSAARHRSSRGPGAR